HIVLRGGSAGPNYDRESVIGCEQALADAGLTANVMVDCSHANSNKDHTRQPLVAESVAEQIAAGNRSIVGLMLESNLGAGNQKLGDPASLEYGVSITDACVDWEETETLLRSLATGLAAPLRDRLGAENQTNAIAAG
ncbi:MAG: 3-deoxy-7-phosphoheptulonate synthase, partial [Gammaproteobacteria bacterium]|nr:3-deoxy-7-phosphoheptulonate synthase [Gammaproteobacteria bacterium]